MPTFTYAGDHDRHYPTLGLTPEPGEAYDLDVDPGDGRWTPAPPAEQDALPEKAAPKAKATTATKEG